METGNKSLKHKDFKKIFKNSIFHECVETVELSSWKDFQKILKIFDKSKNDYIWRGQRKDWQLKSTFDRQPCYSSLTLLDKNKEIRDKILEILLNNLKDNLKKLYKEDHQYNFIKSFPSVLTEHQKDCIWATGQHYFLPTPILDWTDDPYRAAYFAFYKECENENKQCNRIVYALNIKTLKRLLDSKKQRFISFPEFEKDDFVKEIWNRIIKQKSRFTKAKNGTDIETNVNNFWEWANNHNKDYSTEVILAKILIPNKYRKDCLKSLPTEITYIKLFTDYHGAIEICKIDLGLK